MKRAILFVLAIAISMSLLYGCSEKQDVDSPAPSEAILEDDKPALSGVCSDGSTLILSSIPIKGEYEVPEIRLEAYDDKYTPAPLSVEGDAPVSISYSSLYAAANFVLRFSSTDGGYYSLGASEWSNGEKTSVQPLGYVEQLQDGKWVKMPREISFTAPDCLSFGGSGFEKSYGLFAPYDDPGEYRYTLYFRELPSGENENKATTGKQLLTASFPVKIEPMNSSIEIAYARPVSRADDVEVSYDIQCVIRGDSSFIGDSMSDLSDNCTLEYKSESDWVLIDDYWKVKFSDYRKGKNRCFSPEDADGDGTHISYYEPFSTSAYFNMSVNWMLADGVKEYRLIIPIAIGNDNEADNLILNFTVTEGNEK